MSQFYVALTITTGSVTQGAAARPVAKRVRPKLFVSIFTNAGITPLTLKSGKMTSPSSSSLSQTPIVRQRRVRRIQPVFFPYYTLPISPFIAPAPSAILEAQNIRSENFKVVRRTTSQLDTIPKFFDMASNEVFPFGIDATNYMKTGDSITNVTCTLSVIPSGALVTSSWLVGTSVVGNVITITINGVALRKGQSYQLNTNFRLNSNKTMSTITTVNVIA